MNTETWSGLVYLTIVCIPPFSKPYKTGIQQSHKTCRREGKAIRELQVRPELALIVLRIRGLSPPTPLHPQGASSRQHGSRHKSTVDRPHVS